MTATRTAPDLIRFKDILKEKGLKATPQRLAVHEAMLKLGHASADMVAEQMESAGFTRITIASVYNILSTLADLRVYSRRMSSNNKMYFDVNTFKHLHLYDRTCNEYRDVLDDELVGLVESRLKGRRFRGYTVDHIDIQIVCHPTRRKTRSSAE
ncbi:MAG: transcriptional repressor [Bacteroidetes bacterium]|uniref:Transcriptional repressor n=1 Tax=Candidatus Cryptobacteroides avistercoris TaxID=2840758 RepID=A0A9D9IYX4_9BACT|nr:transcriptional repressor [Candidatus Cryptobacteroides avistercoris]